ncbi:MAG: magnesium transporter CorA family protein [Bacteroidetes bacterium]|nr:magnesium transporter CorA family protein [Bacteroidota bacterium]
MITFYKNSSNGLIKTEVREPKSWIMIECPTESEKNYLFNELQIPQAFYNDIEDIDERPRIEIEDGWYLIIIRTPFKTGDEKLPYNTAPLGLIFKDDIFVSVCFHKIEVLDDFVVYTERKNIKIIDSFDLVLKLLLSTSIWFLKHLKQINQLIKHAENNLEKSIRNEDLQILLQIEKCLVYFITSLKGNDILFHRLKNIKNINETFDSELVEDVQIEIRQAQETTNIYSDILSGMMDAYASVISNNLNIVMKRLTAISIILMIPTLIASLYGMNVPNNLENNMLGFWYVLIGCLGFSTIGVLLFRKKNFF